MASIERRENGYLVRLTQAGERKSILMPSRAAAHELVALLDHGLPWEQAVQQEPDEALPDLSFSVVGQAYLRDRARRLSPSTLQIHGRSLDLLARFAAEAAGPNLQPDVTMLSRKMLAAGWEWLLDPNTGRHGRARNPTTARRHIELWQIFWAWVFDHDDYHALVPRARTIDLPAQPTPLPIAPTFDEIDAMIGALASTPKVPAWLHRLALLARYTGGRRTELLLLPWTAVDERRGALRFEAATTKGGYGGRAVPIHPGLQALFKSWPRTTPTVVGAPHCPDPNKDELHVGRGLRRAWARAGVDKSVWVGHPLHSMRAAVRTYLVQQLVHPDVIDAVLGHQGRGTGGRHYTDRGRLWLRLVEAVATIPLHPGAQA